MAEQVYKYQEEVRGDGSAVILNENGVIETYDASGNLVGSCAPGDPEWKTVGASLDLSPAKSA
jgi:hypothetical protein